MSERLSFDDSYDENKRKFVELLVERGWDQDEAEREYDSQINED